MQNIPEEIPLVSAAIAILYSKEATADDLNIVGNLLAAIGSEMMTIAAIRAANTAQTK